MNENKIRGIVLRHYSSIAAFAREINWSRQKASAIINGNQEPSLDECRVIAKAVKKDTIEIVSIFLEMKTQKCV